jgi:8-oxo-dGTP pyrophosphatase MutT (NUDIX family)
MITPFGGKREQDEDHITCLRREFMEELELDLDKTDWRYVGKIPGVRNDGSFLQIFHVKVKSDVPLTCHEGTLIKLSPQEFSVDNRVTDYLKNVVHLCQNHTPHTQELPFIETQSFRETFPFIAQEKTGTMTY